MNAIMHTNRTRSRRLTGLALSALLAASLLAAPGLAEVPQSANTTATVSFLDGELALGGDAGGSGLNLDFGRHMIPAASVSYPAKNEREGTPVPHILQVEDSRYDTGDWHVTVALTPFTTAADGPSDSFSGVIMLVNPTVANVNASAGTAGLSVEDSLSVTSGMGATLVMAAADTLPRGVFTATWANEDITLNIGDSEVVHIGVADYSATLTWTLSQGPI